MCFCAWSFGHESALTRLSAQSRYVFFSHSDLDASYATFASRGVQRWAGFLRSRWSTLDAADRVDALRSDNASVSRGAVAIIDDIPKGMDLGSGSWQSGIDSTDDAAAVELRVGLDKSILYGGYVLFAEKMGSPVPTLRYIPSFASMFI